MNGRVMMGSLVAALGAVAGWASPAGDVLARFANGGEMPGVVSMLYADGKVTTDCAGYADLASKRAIDANSLFWIASNTKGVAAAAFLTLVDEGKVSLDDPVEKYLPEWAGIQVKDRGADGREILRAPKSKPTLRQVLSHTSGLKFFPQMPIDQWPMRLLATLAAKTPLESDPGTRYCYSNWGIDTAMAVLEVVTLQPWEKVLQTRILEPLEMKDTTFFPTEEQLKRLAKAYRLADGKPPAEMLVDQFQQPYSRHSRYAEAGGGLFSTPVDMMKFCRMVAGRGMGPNGRRILSEATMQLWYARQTPAAVKESYSFGMNVGEGTIGHGGAYQTWVECDWRNDTARLYFVQIAGGNKISGECRKAWDGTSKLLLRPAARLTEPKVFEHNGRKLLYRWHAPKTLAAGRRYPLVILFHGAGERGSDNLAQLVHGADELLTFAQKTGEEIFFIAGQVPGGQQWVNTPWSDKAHTMANQPSDSMSLALALVDRTIKELPVDESRVYVTGISMGGYGTWDAVQRRPELFAAAMPICGGGDTGCAEKIKDVPIWCFHGDKDGAVPTSRSRDMFSALKAVDGNIQYREYPGVGHNCWARTYGDDEVLRWFFAQRRAR